MRTAAGTALLGGALALCGLLFAMPSMYVPALALVAASAAAAAWVRLCSRHLLVEQAVAAHTLTEGESLELMVRAELGPWPIPGGTLRIQTSTRHLQAGRRGRLEFRGRRPMERRGRYPVSGVRLEIGDPLGLATRAVETVPEQVLVLPRTEPLRPLRAGEHGSAAAAGLGGAAGVEIDGLRPYRPGASASRIHWPAVARLGELVERRLRADADSAPMVVLDASSPPSADDLDKAVRAAASLCLALARAGGCRVALPGDRRAAHLDPHLRGWPALHARLALVEAGTAPSALTLPRGDATLIWVTAGPRAPVAIARAGWGSRYVVTPHRSGAGGVAFTVAECQGRRLTRAAERAA